MVGENPATTGAPGSSARTDGGGDPAAELSGMGQQQQGVDTAVLSGRLAISPDVAQQAAQVCEDHRRQLHDLRREIDDLGEKVSFGECEVGEQLAAKFVDKAKNGPESLAAMLAAAEQIVDNMAQTYTKAGAAYRHLDSASADALRRTQQQA